MVRGWVSGKTRVGERNERERLRVCVRERKRTEKRLRKCESTEEERNSNYLSFSSLSLFSFSSGGLRLRDSPVLYLWGLPPSSKIGFILVPNAGELWWTPTTCPIPLTTWRMKLGEWLSRPKSCMNLLHL